ncbi:MAG: MarR family transcriptional regulator [Ardenticatenales bacterium]|jgi:hypothetical protein|nr:MarR family transcriptional regulator [Ardenticatenales bacterium]
MQATDWLKVESPPMVRSTPPGVMARRAVLRKIRRRAGAGLDAPSYAELSDETRLGPSSITRPCRTLINAGLVDRIECAARSGVPAAEAQ